MCAYKFCEAFSVVIPNRNGHETWRLFEYSCSPCLLALIDRRHLDCFLFFQWNSHGYTVAKRWGKFTMVSPVWFQIKRKQRGMYNVEGTHDIDKGRLQKVFCSYIYCLLNMIECAKFWQSYIHKLQCPALPTILQWCPLFSRQIPLAKMYPIHILWYIGEKYWSIRT